MADPYIQLTLKEQQEVDAILYGGLPVEPNTKESCVPSKICTTDAFDDGTAVTRSSDDGADHASVKSKESAGSSSIGCKILSSAMHQPSWGDCSASNLGDGESIVSGWSHTTDDIDTTSLAAAMPARSEANKRNKSACPAIYAKNKTLLADAKASRFKKYIDDLSATNGKTKPAVVQKHLNNLVLAAMKDEKGVKDMVAALNGIRVICCEVLQNPKFEKNVQITTLACSLLGLLAKGSDERKALVHEEKGVIIILSKVQSFSTKELVLHEEAFVALYHIAQDEANALQFTEVPQALYILLRTMKAHKGRSGIQRPCLGLLLRLCHVNYDYVIQPGVFDVCVSGLNKNKGNVSLQKLGCLFWRQVVACCDDKKNVDANGAKIEMLVNAKVPECLFQTMQNHIQEAYIVRNVLGTFALLCERNEKISTIVTENLADFMKAGLKHGKDVATQREAYKILRFIKNLPQGCLKLPKAMLQDDEVRVAFLRAQIDPNRIRAI